ncbi:hypothetical protein Ciccas_006116 [Cichlidogyrus casuarinus]|uniref:Uncharacterized protein n=1 Tax=Cichlidogyrus casuarinus TaxID=1844966 RepID=A0ABD2Q7W2_9PLAT
MLAEYTDKFASYAPDLTHEDSLASQSVVAMLIFLKKCTFNSHFQNSSHLMYQSLRFIDAVLSRFAPEGSDQNPPKVVALSIDLLLNIECISTYSCYVPVLLVCNSLINLWTKKLGDLNKLANEDLISSEFMMGNRRMSHLENSSLDLSIEQRKTRSRGLSSAEVITNASFRPVIVPEDITVDEPNYEESSASQTTDHRKNKISGKPKARQRTEKQIPSS